MVDASLTSGNTHVDGIVSFIDFAPTILTLAGIDKAQHYPGKAFLSESISLKELNKRDEVYAQADRFDEKSDFVRSVRKGKFKYVRHYQPYYPDGLENYYRYKQQAYKQWRDLYQSGELNQQQSAFFEPKTVEALYDLQTDPYETNNLATSAQYQNQLKKCVSY